MRRRMAYLALGAAAVAVSLVSASWVGARTASDNIVTTISVYDGPPEDGGQVRQALPSEPVPATGDPRAILKGNPHPIAALEPGEVPAEWVDPEPPQSD